MEHNRGCDTIAKIHGNSQSAHLTLNVHEFNKKVAVTETNATQSPHTIRNHTQVAELSVVIPEQSKFSRPVDTAILSMNTEGDLDLTTYLIELLRTNAPEKLNVTIWFPTPENLSKNEDHTPIQTRILKKID